MVVEVMMVGAARIPLVYALHSGNLYGTERMALYTAAGLSDSFKTTVLAPPGPVHDEAARMGFESRTFGSAGQFAGELRRQMSRVPRLAFLATGVVHSLACLGWNKVYRRRIAHLHMVHGGAEERLSYGRKRWLNGWPVRFIAVSKYVSQRLTANGVRGQQITVIENFMTDRAVAKSSGRADFAEGGIHRIAVVSRLDPVKRVDVLLQALEENPDLGRIEFSLFGSGWNDEALKERAARSGLNVKFEGFQADIGQRLAASDLLVHLCPVEPFGLAVLEAMAARIPVLVPDTGGAASLIEPDYSGFRFEANNSESLAQAIRRIGSLNPSVLNDIVRNASRLLATRFSERERIADYRRLLQEMLA
jgi:glycosyltransferase involved in cell wall biosynthesis